MEATETLKGKHIESLLSRLEFAAAVGSVLLPVELQLVMMLPENMFVVLALAFVPDGADVGIQGC